MQNRFLSKPKSQMCFATANFKLFSSISITQLNFRRLMYQNRGKKSD